MNKYLIKGKTAKAVAEYEADGLLHSVKFDGGDEPARSWLLRNLPTDESHIAAFGAQYAHRLQVVATPPDLSFNAFWDSYGYKVGKKDKVEQLWKSLSEADKIACLKAVPKYNRWIASKTSMEKAYPQTFLNQRRWENEFAA